MQIFTVNNVKDTRTLRIFLLLLKSCRNSFLTWMRKTKHLGVSCCPLYFKHKKHPQLKLIYLPGPGCAFSDEISNRSSLGYL